MLIVPLTVGWIGLNLRLGRPHPGKKIVTPEV